MRLLILPNLSSLKWDRTVLVSVTFSLGNVHKLRNATREINVDVTNGCKDGASSIPKFVLRLKSDKGLTSIWYFCFLLYSQIKVERLWGCYFSMKYWRTGDINTLKWKVMCAKLRTYKLLLLLLLRLSGAYSTIQIFYIYKLILYLLFTSHGTIAFMNGPLPVTSKCPIWLSIGSVLIWHMYHPWSVGLTSRIVNFQCFRSVDVVTVSRWFLDTIMSFIDKIVWVSTRSQAIWKKKIFILNMRRWR